MKKKVLKTLFCFSLSAAMLLGEAGAVLADTAMVKVEVTEENADNSREEKDVSALEATDEVTNDEKAEKIVSAYNLEDVTGLAYDASTGILSWNKVKGATKYVVEKLDEKGKVVSTRETSDVYMNIRNCFDYENDKAYTFRVKAYNYVEAYQVAADVAGDERSQYDETRQESVYGIYSYNAATGTYTLLYESGVAYDFCVSKTVETTDGDKTTYTLYKYPSSANGAAIATVVKYSTNKAVTALAGVAVKEACECDVTFSVTPASTLQPGESICYEYANNAGFVSDDEQDMYVYEGENESYGYWDEGTQLARTEFTVDFSSFDAGDTIYVKAYVYNPSYDYTAVAGQTEENRKSAPVTTTYAIPVAKMSSVSAVVTKDSIRLIPDATGEVTGYQYQRKNGKKWITLAQQGDNYTDAGLKADTEYTYKVRGYIYNKKTGKTAYTDWKTVKATTWGSNLNVNASAASKKSVKLTWAKVAGAEGYEIYRYDTNSTGYNTKNGITTDHFHNATLVKTIKKAKTTKYTDKKLVAGNSYSYVVRAYRTMGKTKCYIEDSADVTLSGRGMDVTASYYNAKGQLVVKWNKMTDISGYKVEKYNDVTRKYDAYKTLKKNATSITLPAVTVGAEDVTYRIRPYKGATVYNGVSYDVEAVLAAVKNVKAVQTAEGVQVSWSPVAGADYYQVYRAKKDSYSYDQTTKTYTFGSDADLVYEANYQDTSAGLSLAPVGAPETFSPTSYERIVIPATSVETVTYEDEDETYYYYYYTDAEGIRHSLSKTIDENGNVEYYYYGDVKSTNVYTRYAYDKALDYAVNDGQFYDPVTYYSTSQITGTTVVDKTIKVTSLIPKTEDPAYNKDTDSEYVKEEEYYAGSYGAYQKNADGSLKTKTVTKVNGPEVGTEYYYFVVACAKPANGANENSTTTTSLGYGKSAKVVYTNVTVDKTTKVTSAKSSKKETATLKFKKVSGVKGYAVYRSTKKNGTYTQIGTSTKPNYTDNNATGGKTYYYKVATYKQSENGTFIYSKLSSAKKVKIKK